MIKTNSKKLMQGSKTFNPLNVGMIIASFCLLTFLTAAAIPNTIDSSTHPRGACQVDPNSPGC